MLLASGYLKVESYEIDAVNGKEEYGLKLTNMEVRRMFEQMIDGWFKEYTHDYNTFIKASLLDKGIPAERIRKYGFAFRGKEVLIGYE